MGLCLNPKSLALAYEYRGNPLTLQDLIHDESCQWNVSQVLKVAKDIASALEYIHQCNVHHLNLNSHSVLVSPEVGEGGY
jgi:serine/threonine protein kinase